MKQKKQSLEWWHLVTGYIIIIIIIIIIRCWKITKCFVITIITIIIINITSQTLIQYHALYVHTHEHYHETKKIQIKLDGYHANKHSFPMHWQKNFLNEVALYTLKSNNHSRSWETKTNKKETKIQVMRLTRSPQNHYTVTQIDRLIGV